MGKKSKPTWLQQVSCFKFTVSRIEPFERQLVDLQLCSCHSFHQELCISLFQSALKDMILSSCNNQCGLHKKPAEMEFIIVTVQP